MVPGHLFPKQTRLVNEMRVKTQKGYDELELAEYYLNRTWSEFSQAVLESRQTRRVPEKERIQDICELGNNVSESVKTLIDNRQKEYQITRAQAVMFISLAERIMSLLMLAVSEKEAKELSDLSLQLNYEAINILKTFLSMSNLSSEEQYMAAKICNDCIELYNSFNQNR